MSTRFNQPNDPNAARLIESLRHLGYDNYVALADIVDNSIDADADEVKIKVWTERGEVRISVSDNGSGMDNGTLDQALRLGSLTAKDPVTDLGKFGMGLVTAGLSMARRTTVISKQDDKYLTSIVDIDEIINTNKFCKSLGESTSEERALLDAEFPMSVSATLVVFDKCDGIRNQNTTVFSGTLRNHLGRVHRYFLKAGKKIFVNETLVNIVDPLEIDNSETEIFSDEEYPISIKLDGTDREEKIRVRIALLAENVSGGERELTLSLKNQGFYILRNNREIMGAETLDAFSKHNDFNRMRGEVFLSGVLDVAIGIDFTKRDLVLDQSFKDQLLKYLKGQCTTIKRNESGRARVKETGEIEGLHKQAEKQIDQMAKLLIVPKSIVERRRSRGKKNGTTRLTETHRSRDHFSDVQPADARRVKFLYHKLGPNGQIYECDLHGRTIEIRWNIDHPFYQRFVLDQRSDGRLVTAVDYLVYSMASAELANISDENIDMVNNFKAIVSSNVRTLLS